MTFFYLCIQFCSQVTRLPQTRVCGAGVVRKSMGTFSCAKDLIVKFNGFRMFFFFGFACDYCTAQCFLSIDQTILLGVNSLIIQLSVNDQSHIKIRVVMTKG